MKKVKICQGKGLLVFYMCEICFLTIEIAEYLLQFTLGSSRLFSLSSLVTFSFKDMNSLIQLGLMERKTEKPPIPAMIQISILKSELSKITPES